MISASFLPILSSRLMQIKVDAVLLARLAVCMLMVIQMFGMISRGQQCLVPFRVLIDLFQSW